MPHPRRMHRPSRHDVAAARLCRHHHATHSCSPLLRSPWYWMRGAAALRRVHGPRATGARWPWRSDGSEGAGGSRWVALATG